MTEYVILVDENDNEIGTEEKIAAHRFAQLHRAFSIFIFNKNDELLLQRRAGSKYHCPMLWTNTCCSHPRQNESTIDAAHRRLTEEMGFDTLLTEKFIFQYSVKFDNGLTENEIDHVLFGRYDGKITLNLKEAESYRWISLSNLKKEIAKNPNSFTPWFLIALEKIESFNS